MIFGFLIIENCLKFGICHLEFYTSVSKMNKTLSLPISAVFWLLSLLFVVSVFAQENSREDVDAIIQGFEDETPAREEIDELMQGFEEEPAENPEEQPDEDEILQGFEEEADEEIISETAKEKIPQSWSIDGEFGFTTTYNFSPDAVPPLERTFHAALGTGAYPEE